MGAARLAPALRLAGDARYAPLYGARPKEQFSVYQSN